MGTREDHERKLHQARLDHYHERTIAVIAATLLAGVSYGGEVTEETMKASVADATKLWEIVDAHFRPPAEEEEEEVDCR